MLKESPHETGCLRGCLWSILAGGGIGAAAGYWFAGRYVPNQQIQGIYLLLRVSFAAGGFLIGGLIWGLFQWIYLRFIKGEQEEAI